MKRIFISAAVALSLLTAIFSVSSCAKFTYAPVFMLPDTLYNGVTAKLILTRKVVYEYEFTSEAKDLSFSNPSGRDWYVEVNIADGQEREVTVHARNASMPEDKDYTFGRRTVLMPWFVSSEKVYAYTEDGKTKYTADPELAKATEWDGLYRVGVYYMHDGEPTYVPAIETASMGLDRYAHIGWEYDRSKVNLVKENSASLVFRLKNPADEIHFKASLGKVSSEYLFKE